MIKVAKYRKLPVIVEAFQWLTNSDDPKDNVKRYTGPGGIICKHCGNIMSNHGWIDTLEGGHIVCPGDWIITGIKGEMYPCKDDVFQATYEMLDD